MSGNLRGSMKGEPVSAVNPMKLTQYMSRISDFLRQLRPVIPAYCCSNVKPERMKILGKLL